MNIDDISQQNKKTAAAIASTNMIQKLMAIIFKKNNRNFCFDKINIENPITELKTVIIVIFTFLVVHMCCRVINNQGRIQELA